MEGNNCSLKIFSLGLQHVLAMYAGAILVPLIVGRALNLISQQLAYLVAIDLLTCGIATLLQRGKINILALGCLLYWGVLLLPLSSAIYLFKYRLEI